MRIIKKKTIKEYGDAHPSAKAALNEWAQKVEKAQWNNLADVKKMFLSADYIGNQRYVFNIKGNDYRIVLVLQFTPKLAYLRFIGTHTEYSKLSKQQLLMI